MPVLKRTKNTKAPLLKQILSFIPTHILRYNIDKHNADKGCSKYLTYDQLVALTF